MRLHFEDVLGMILCELTHTEAAMIPLVERAFWAQRKEWAAGPARDAIARGDACEKQRDWPQALHFYALSDAIYPQSTTLLKLAEVQGKCPGVAPEVARSAVERAIERDASCEAKAYDVCGKILIYQGETSEGIKAFERSLACKDDAEVRLHCGRAMRERGCHEKALEHITWAIEMVKTGSQVCSKELEGSMYNELGMLQLLSGDADAAAESIRHAADLYPKFVLNLSTSMSAQGDIDGAVENLECALQKHPGDPVILGNLAGLKMRQADSSDDDQRRSELYQQAEALCRQVIDSREETGPGLAGDSEGDSMANRVNAFMNLSQLCALLGNWDEAIEHGSAAVELQLLDDQNPDRHTGSVAAHFIGPDGIPKVSPREHHTGHLHFTLAHMLVHRALQAEHAASPANDDLRMAAHHMSEAIMKFTQLAESHGTWMEGAVSRTEMVEQFQSILPVGTAVMLTGLKDERFNLQKGFVIGELSSTGRMCVRLMSGKTCNVKPINIAFGVGWNAESHFLDA